MNSNTDLCFFKPESFRLTFNSDGKEVGQFYWDEEKCQFVFEGKTDESAKLFTNYVTKQCKDWFEDKYGMDR